MQFRKRKDNGQAFPLTSKKSTIQTNPNDRPQGVKIGKGYKVPKDEGKEKKDFYLSSSFFSLGISDGKVDKVSLDDFGWRWSGDEKDLNTFMVRMALSEDPFVELEKQSKEQGLEFDLLKKQMLENLKGELTSENDDGLYALTGDNGRWKFSTDDESIDTGAEFDYEFEEGRLRENEKEKFEDLFWNNYESVDYDEFLERSGKHWRTRMKEEIEESKTFDDYGAGIEGIREGINDDFEEQKFEKMRDATSKAVDAIKASRDETGKTEG